ncbi:MAG: PQQ-binding-like beta-propeller repeat protein, partial [Candidatus Micrarchaeia archaeon]
MKSSNENEKGKKEIKKKIKKKKIKKEIKKKKEVKRRNERKSERKSEKLILFFFFFLLISSIFYSEAIKWKYQTNEITQANLILVDNRICSFSVKGVINCFNRYGSRLFTKEIGKAIYDDPIYDGKIYIPVEDGLYKMERDGYISEKFIVNESFLTPISYESLIIAPSNKTVFVFEKDKISNPIRKIDFGEEIATAVLAKGKLYVLTKDGIVYSVDPYSGSKVKFFSVNFGIGNAAAFLENKIVFGAENYLVSFYLGGGKAFEKRLESWINSIVTDGERIYVGTNRGLVVFDKEGEEIGRFYTEDAVRKKVKIVNQTIYVPSNDKSLYALSKNLSLKWKITLTDWVSSPVYNDGMIFVVTYDGTVFGISTLNCIIDRPAENGTIFTNAYFFGRAYADSGIESVEITTVPGEWKVISREENWVGNLIISGFDEGKILFKCRVRDKEGNVEEEPYFSLELNYV